MKNIITISLGVLLFLVGNYQVSAQTCPVPPPCTYTATSGTNYTVNAGEILCINSPTNYNSGTITLNGGSVYVASGATLGTDIAPTTASTITVCGTLSGTRKFNSNTTLNNYGSSTVSIDYANGGIINNYSNGSNISLTNVTTTTPAASFTNYGTGVTLAISNWNSTLNLTNATGATMTVASSPTVHSGSTITNSGTLAWTQQLVMNAGSTLNNTTGATLNVNNASGANFNGATFNNDGTANFATGPTIQSGSTINNSAGAIINSLSGKLDITGAGTTFNNSGAVTATCSTGGCTSIIVQNSAVMNNYATGSVTASAGLFDTTGGSTINNYGAVTAYDLRINSGIAFNMFDATTLSVTHQITTLDSPIGNPSGCAYIDLTGFVQGGACLNQNVSNSAGVNVCGQVPYCDGATKTITGATNASPIVITSAGHGLVNGAKIVITGVVGNTAANQYYTVANVTANTFELVGSMGNGAYVSGGKIHLSVKLGSANYLGNSGCTNPCPAVLAVKWNAFEAVSHEAAVLLSWSTAQEKNTYEFAVQKSLDGINFITIGYVKAAGNSSHVNEYNFADSHPSEGEAYYRIKEIDQNGSSYYSSIASVKRTSNEDWVIYPNPSNGDEIFFRSTNASGKVHISLTDALGQTVSESDFSVSSESVIPLVSSKLAPGFYAVQVTTASSRKTEKLIVR